MSTTSECSRLLRELLRDGPRAREEIARSAQEAGFTDKHLRTAREALAVQSKRYGFGPGSAAWWSLPEGGGAEPSHTCHTTWTLTTTRHRCPLLHRRVVRSPPALSWDAVIDPEFPRGNAYDRAAAGKLDLSDVRRPTGGGGEVGTDLLRPVLPATDSGSDHSERLVPSRGLGLAPHVAVAAVLVGGSAAGVGRLGKLGQATKEQLAPAVCSTQTALFVRSAPSAAR